MPIATLASNAGSSRLPHRPPRPPPLPAEAQPTACHPSDASAREPRLTGTARGPIPRPRCHAAAAATAASFRPRPQRPAAASAQSCRSRCLRPQGTRRNAAVSAGPSGARTTARTYTNNRKPLSGWNGGHTNMAERNQRHTDCAWRGREHAASCCRWRVARHCCRCCCCQSAREPQPPRTSAEHKQI